MGKDFQPLRRSYKSNSKRYTFLKLLLPLFVIQYLQIMQTFAIKKLVVYKTNY